MMKLSRNHTLLSSALLLLPCVADALEFPSPKPGLWEIRAQNFSDGKTGDKDGTMQQCMDAATMAASKQMNDEYNKKNCSKNETRRDGNKWIRSLICKVGASTLNGQQTLEFNGDNAYHSEGISNYDPAFSGLTRKRLIVDAKWLGPCK